MTKATKVTNRTVIFHPEKVTKVTNTPRRGVCHCHSVMNGLKNNKIEFLAIGIQGDKNALERGGLETSPWRKQT